MAFPNYYVILSGIYAGQIMTPTYFSASINNFQHFYANFSRSSNSISEFKQGNIVNSQVFQNTVSPSVSKQPLKRIRKQKHKKPMKDLRQQNRIKKDKTPKIYQRDEDRNILPNAISKIFFFLRSKKRSKNLLQKILQSNVEYSSQISYLKYYTYQNIIRENLTRYMTQDTLEKLFVFIDPEFKLFSFKEQLTFIKINGILLRIFIKKNIYLQTISSSPLKSKNKIKVYLQKYRKIQEKINQYQEKAKKQILLQRIPSQQQRKSVNQEKMMH